MLFYVGGRTFRKLVSYLINVVVLVILRKLGETVNKMNIVLGFICIAFGVIADVFLEMSPLGLPLGCTQ